MEIGVVGLGRMGANMARRMARGGARVVAFDREPGAGLALKDEKNIACVESLASLATKLAGERVVLVMLPAGPATEDALAELLPLLSAGDTLVDGGNAFYKDSMARALKMSQRGLRYIDAGVSGGIHGLANGYCLMLGGTAKSVERFEPFARILAPAPDTGWLHCGPSGAGHFAKMIHNGIEYGMMQAFAEGFALLAARKDLEFDLGRLAETWRHGSVVRSWLLDLLAAALAREGDELAHLRGWVEDSGEGRWALETAVAHAVPTPALAAALFARFRSRQEDPYGAKILALLRHEFGGHAVRREPDAETP